MQPLQADELKSFFAYVTALLEYLNIPYMVVGGFAAIFYGEPRFTWDYLNFSMLQRGAAASEQQSLLEQLILLARQEIDE